MLALSYLITSWWRRWESNPRPFECHSNALPIELQPHICLLQVRLRILYRVSIPGIVRTICSFPPILSQLVPTAGLEPARLSTLHSECSMSAISSRGHIWQSGEYFIATVCNPHWELLFGYPVPRPMTGASGGDSGTWTHMVSLPSDFESDASANSTISPNKTHFRGLQPHTAASLAVLGFQ